VLLVLAVLLVLLLLVMHLSLGSQLAQGQEQLHNIFN
jgi:uncharacterized membrane protein affecting hemolysin expression